jgi:hypothetical protein
MPWLDLEAVIKKCSCRDCQLGWQILGASPKLLNAGPQRTPNLEEQVFDKTFS